MGSRQVIENGSTGFNHAQLLLGFCFFPNRFGQTSSGQREASRATQGEFDTLPRSVSR